MNGRLIGWMTVCAGAAASCAMGSDGAEVVDRGEVIARGRGIVAGRIYVNATTGERVEMPLSSFGGGRAYRGDDEGSTRVWINNNSDPCGYGDPDGPDNIPGTADDDQEFDGIGIVSTGRQSGRLNMHWGDVPGDSRVNGLGFWVWHNYRGPEGTTIEGFDTTYSFFDGGDGRLMTGGAINPEFQPLASVTVESLPAADPALGTGYVNGFYFLVDLSDPDPRLAQTFELGDRDGQGPFSGMFNPGSYFDSPTDVMSAPSGVGLHDFVYTIQYQHPLGATDEELGAVMQAIGDVTYLLSDTDGDGDLENTFVPLVDNGETAGAGDDFLRVWSGIDPVTGLPEGHMMASFFGGFDCGFSRNDSIRNPHSRALLEMYYEAPGRPAPCPVDWEVDNDIDIFDLIAFLNSWNASMGMTGPGLEVDFNGDEMVDVFDIIVFLGEWNAAAGGAPCPEESEG